MSLSEDIERIAKEEGYDSSCEFVQHCIIYRSWSFARIGAYLARAYNRHYSDIHVISYCRPFIKGRITPYRIRKWNGYAKQKGYPSAIAMFRDLSKLSLIKISEVCPTIPRAELNRLVTECSLSPVNRIRKKRLVYHGVRYLATAKKWHRAAQLLGYRNVQQMLKNWPHSIKRLAQAIGVHEQAVYYMKRKMK